MTKKFHLNKGLMQLLVAAYFILFGSLAWRHLELFKYFSVSMGALLLFAVASALIANGHINYFLFRSFAVGLTRHDGLKLAVLNNIGNYLPLSFGLISKGIYLKRVFGLGYGDYVSLSLAMVILHASISGILGLAALYRLGITRLEVILPFLFLALLGVTLRMPSYLAHTALFRGKIEKLKGAQAAFKKNFAQLSLWQLIYIVFQSAILLISFSAIGQSLGPWHILLYACGLTAIRFVSILPAGIGVRELIVIALGTYTGLGITAAVLAVGIARITTIFVVFTWGFLMYSKEVREAYHA